MQYLSLYVALAAFVGALIALLLYHLVIVAPPINRLRRSLEVHDGLIAGGAGAEDRLGRVEAGHAAHEAELARLRAQVAQLAARSEGDLSQTGFVRYDAFADSESGLSYALALLNRKGDGVVLTSIYSRNDTRTFGKGVEGFTPAAHASAEELDAIQRARNAASQNV